VGVVKEVTVSEDPSRNFVVSSPSNGVASEEEGYIATNPYSGLYGDNHYYNYKENNWDWTTYPKTRFASEYGFQSYPSFEILEPVSEIWDWSFSSAWMTHRQHHPGGNLELQWQISLNMDLELDSLENTEGWQEFLYLAHVYQAVSLKTETETYRRGMSMPDPDTGEGMTMGALYWQLNDIWQGASWASMEFGGKWKMSHYYAEKFFKPVLISPIIEGDDVNVYGVCDHKEHNLKLKIKTFHWDSFTPTYTSSVSLGPGCVRPGSVILYTTPLADLLSLGSCHPGSYDEERLDYCLVTFHLYSEGEDLLSENYLMAPPRSVSLRAHNIRASVTGLVNQVPTGPYVESYTITVEADNIALFVWLEATGLRGRFSDNGFILNTQVREVVFLSREFISNNLLEEALTVRAYNKPWVTSY